MSDVLSEFQPFDPNRPVSIRRRYLPHWEQEGATYFVTFRLVDALPASRVKELAELRDQLVGDSADVERIPEAYKRIFAKLDEYLDAGSGECLLGEPDAQRVMADVLPFFDPVRYRLFRFVVMPNHVHAVFKPLPGFDLSEILHSWKSYSAGVINQALHRAGTVWQVESYDHLVRDGVELQRILKYVEQNPEKAGLCTGQYVLG